MADSRDPQELQARLKEVLADKEFAIELIQTEKPEDVQTALEGRGIELSLDEIRKMGEVLRKAAGGEDAPGELSEDELAEVAGGSVFEDFYKDVQNFAVQLGSTIGNFFASW